MTPSPEPNILESVGLPSPEQAEAFAIMLNVGMPPADAMGYFVDLSDWNPGAIRGLADRWLRSRLVVAASRKLMGKGWEEMTAEERIKHAVDKHYGELAYFLYSHNYSTLEGVDKIKADTARQVLEAKLAGLAGQLDPMARFWDDFRKGMLEGKLGRPRPVPPPPTLPS